MKVHSNLFRKLYLSILLSLSMLWGATPAHSQETPTNAGRNRPYSLLEVLTLSAFGGEVPEFTPLSIFDFGEGWLTPWIPPPNGELHLQRGGWVGADSAFFSREFDPAFTFNAGTAGSRDEFIGSATLFVPLNRHFQIGLTVPFVDSLQSTDVLPSATSFGDVVITPQLMLDQTETRDISLLVSIQTPTGQTSTGNGKTIVTPTLALWQDLPAGWQLRSGIGLAVATHTGEGAHEVLNLNLALGKTLTTHEAAPFGDLTPYLSANLNQNLGGSRELTEVILTPGIRFFLGWHTYFITGVNVPVTNPKPFLPGLTIVLSRGW
jgi:hypothetical protein